MRALRLHHGREALSRENSKNNEMTMTATYVPRNGGSDCVGDRALSAGIFMKNWAIKTKTLR
jgi:hypothetical protein